MNNLKGLHTSKQYNVITEIWNNSETHADFNEWDFLFCINAFYALKQYDNCLSVYKECNSKFPECNMLDNKMGWSLYYTKIKPFDFKNSDTTELLRQIDYILEHCDESQYSPRWCVVNFITKAIMDGKVGEERDFSLVEKYLLQVNPDTLSKEENKTNNGRPLPSNYESWYSRMTKTLLDQKKYDECIKCCDKALTTVSKFHNNNDVWFGYRKALSLRETGAEDTGVEIIKNCLCSGFQHACLYEYLFNNAIKIGDTEKINFYASKAAFSNREYGMRILAINFSNCIINYSIFISKRMVLFSDRNFCYFNDILKLKK